MQKFARSLRVSRGKHRLVGWWCRLWGRKSGSVGQEIQKIKRTAAEATVRELEFALRVQRVRWADVWPHKGKPAGNAECFGQPPWT